MGSNPDGRSYVYAQMHAMHPRLCVWQLVMILAILRRPCPKYAQAQGATAFNEGQKSAVASPPHQKEGHFKAKDMRFHRHSDALAKPLCIHTVKLSLVRVWAQLVKRTGFIAMQVGVQLPGGQGVELASCPSHKSAVPGLTCPSL